MRNMTIALALVLALAGCNTANPFVRLAPDYSEVPKEALEEVALAVEEAVARGDREAVIEGRDGIVLDTPEIRQALRVRAARYEVVRDLLDTGHLYEGASGTIYIERTSAYKKAYSGSQRDRHAMVVQEENKSRWTLYEGIVRASNLSPRALSAVQETFFQARLSLMKPGQRYEDPSGAIVSK